MKLSNWFYSTDIYSYDHDDYATDVFIDFYTDDIKKVAGSSAGKKRAFIYSVGPTDHHINNRVVHGIDVLSSNTGILSQSWYTAARYAKIIGDVSYMTITSNTCADTMYGVHHARMLIENEGFDEVIVLAEELINDATRNLFKQLKIDVKLGDGFVVAKFTKDGEGIEVLDTAWEFKLGASPMSFGTDGYMQVVEKLEKWKPVWVKSHGTGTPSNTEAEEEVIKYLGAKEVHRYKKDIGHMQGASALLELCKCVDDGYKGRILGLASGAGGFYGGVVIEV